MPPEATIDVEIVCAIELAHWRRRLTLPSGSTVATALPMIREVAAEARITLDPERIGIFGKRVKPSQLLSHGDRLELYRDLLIDPKTARRQRVAKS